MSKSSDLVRPQLDGHRMLSMRQVVALTTMSRPTIYRLAEQGKFARLVRLSESRIGFREAEVVEWIAKRCEGRDGLSQSA